MVMGVLAGSDGNTASDMDRARVHVSTVSPLVAGILLANAHRQAEDFATALPAIVLCADIAGISIAGAALTRSGEREAEELRSIVSSVFDPVTDAIRAAGGQILQFSGDAVTAAWPSARAGGRLPVARGTDGAVGLQQCRSRGFSDPRAEDR